jgi:hypothetical protein
MLPCIELCVMQVMIVSVMYGFVPCALPLFYHYKAEVACFSSAVIAFLSSVKLLRNIPEHTIRATSLVATS